MSPVRGTRVLDGVSSPRPDSDDTCDRVRVLLRAIRIAQRRQHASTTDNRASSNAGLRRATRDAKRAGVPPPQIGFGARRRLQVVEDARRGIRISILETSDVGLNERNTEKTSSDLNSEL